MINNLFKDISKPTNTKSKDFVALNKKKENLSRRSTQYDKMLTTLNKRL